MHMFQLNSSILLVFAPFHEVDLLSPRGLARFFGVSIPPSVESRMETNRSRFAAGEVPESDQ